MATTRQPRQLLIVWNDAGTEVKGATFEESLFVDGAFWKNELTPVAPNSFGEFGELFSNQLQIQYDAVVAEKENLLSEKTTFESQKATLETQIASLEAQLEALLNPAGPDVTTREGLKLYLAQKRYEKEIAGFNVGSQLISTNRDELAHWFARFFDAFNHLQGNASASGGVYPYKPRGGTTVVNLTAEQAVRAYQCLAWYVNACIATEGELIAMVESSQLSALADVKEVIDNAATWPQQAFEWVPS